MKFFPEATDRYYYSISALGPYSVRVMIFEKKTFRDKFIKDNVLYQVGHSRVEQDQFYISDEVREAMKAAMELDSPAKLLKRAHEWGSSTIDEILKREDNKFWLSVLCLSHPRRIEQAVECEEKLQEEKKPAKKKTVRKKNTRKAR